VATTAEILNAIWNQATEYIAVKLTGVQYDDTDKLAVSLHGKVTAAGDTAVLTNARGGLVTIGTRHWHLHEGNMFTAHVDNEVTNTNEMTVIAFNVPAAIPTHLWISAASTHAADLYLYENTSIDVDEGTDQAPINRNRSGTPPTSDMLSIKTTPVANQVSVYLEAAAALANITTTTELDHQPLIGGAGPKALGALGQDDYGYHLDNEQQYAIVLKAGTNDTAQHHLVVVWVEG